MALLRPPKIVRAELFQKELLGQSKALTIVARSEEGEAVDCIIKLNSRLKFPPTEHLREWLACAIGTVLGITVPTAYQVEIDEEFATAVEDQAVRRDALRSKPLSPVFGCSIFSGGSQFTAGERLRPALLPSASTLLAFDVFIHNVDRRLQNHNVFVRREEFAAFDHGDAFAFIFPLFGAPSPSEDPCDSLVDQHVLRPSLRGLELPLEDFYEALTGLTDNVFAEIQSLTPVAWTEGPAAGKLEEIIRVLCERRDAVKKWLPIVQQRVRK